MKTVRFAMTCIMPFLLFNTGYAGESRDSFPSKCAEFLSSFSLSISDAWSKTKAVETVTLFFGPGDKWERSKEAYRDFKLSDFLGKKIRTEYRNKEEGWLLVDDDDSPMVVKEQLVVGINQEPSIIQKSIKSLLKESLNDINEKQFIEVGTWVVKSKKGWFSSHYFSSESKFYIDGESSFSELTKLLYTNSEKASNIEEIHFIHTHPWNAPLSKSDIDFSKLIIANLTLVNFFPKIGFYMHAVPVGSNGLIDVVHFIPTLEVPSKNIRMK